jgi:iron transport multicopper oxidase
MIPLVPATLLCLFTLSSAELIELFWNISYTEANPDGLFTRRVIGINGTWPPPPIHISINDTLRVHAFNSLDQPSSIHHHGMYFNGTSYFDGALGVTQCGIPTGAEYVYDVDVQSWNQWGTYWVHAHSNGQYVDGLRAPFVIHRNEDFVSNPSGNSESDYKNSVSCFYYLF